MPRTPVRNPSAQLYHKLTKSAQTYETKERKTGERNRSRPRLRSIPNNLRNRHSRWGINNRLNVLDAEKYDNKQNPGDHTAHQVCVDHSPGNIYSRALHFFSHVHNGVVAV
jgi:hypothetical protein